MDGEGGAQRLATQFVGAIVTEGVAAPALDDLEVVPDVAATEGEHDGAGDVVTGAFESESHG